MSSVSKVNNSYEVNIPEGFEYALASTTVAKPQEASEQVGMLSTLKRRVSNLVSRSSPSAQESTVNTVFNGVSQMIKALGDRKNQPTDEQVRTSKELLIKLRDICQKTHTEATDSQKQAHAKDPRIPLLGYRIAFLAKSESRSLDSGIKTLQSHQSNIAAAFKLLEAKEAKLTQEKATINQHQLALKLPQVKPFTNMDLKLEMGTMNAKLIFVDGKQQQSVRGIFDALSNSLGLNYGESVLQTRASVFGVAGGMVHKNMTGLDLEVLRNAQESGFNAVVSSFEQHCLKQVGKDGKAYFVPSERVEDRKISISKEADGNIKISHETTFALAAVAGEEPVATVTAARTTILDASGKVLKQSCLVNNIILGRVRIYDLEALKNNLFPQKAKITAPAATASAQ